MQQGPELLAYVDSMVAEARGLFHFFKRFLPPLFSGWCSSAGVHLDHRGCLYLLYQSG